MASGPLVGLDIGTQQIKAVEMRPGKGGAFTVSALGVAPTPLGVMQNNIITDPKSMGQAIKQLLRESGITAKKVVGSVAGQSAVVVRIIEVPRMTDAELKETMKWEVERHVPFAPNETVMAYQPLQATGLDENNPNMEVLLAVAQQDIISNFVDTVFAAGLDPAAIDIEPLAAGRALLDLLDGRPVVRPQFPVGQAPPPDYDGPRETVAIVNIGAANTDISIFQDGELTFPRSLPLAGDSLSRAVADMQGVSIDQAERLKREFGTVQLDRMGLYTGTAYGDDAGYDAPTFQEEEPSFTASSLPDDMSTSPFDLSGDTGFLGANPFSDTPEPEAEMERTQPIERRTLNLARRPEAENPLPFMPPADGGAEAFATTGGNEQSLRDSVFQAIAPVLGELATELRRSLDYYRSRAQGRSVDRVILSGGTAQLGNIGPFLQSELQIPVAIASPLQGLDVTSKHYDPAYLQTMAAAFTIAVGLAARNAVFDANPVPKAPKPARAPKKAKATTGQGGNVTNPPTS